MAITDPPTDLLNALRHPQRLEILAVYWQYGSPISPSEISDVLNEPLANLAYHIRLLCDPYGLLDLVDAKPKKGSTEHFYVTSETARGSDLVKRLVEPLEVPLPLPRSRVPPTAATFNIYADRVLDNAERLIVEYRRGWNGRGRTSREVIAKTLDVDVMHIRRIERCALYKVARAEYDDDQQRTGT